MTTHPCAATLRDGILELSTGRVAYRSKWNDGHLVGTCIEHLEDGVSWALGGDSPDAEFPGQLVAPADGAFSCSEQAATGVLHAHLRAEVVTRLDGLHVKRVFRLYPGCPLIGCDLYLRGTVSD